MEQRKEIKDGVKQRIIEFMAEQITKEESFAELKKELVQEYLMNKEIKTPVIKEVAPLELLNAYEKTAVRAESSLQKIKDKQAEFYKKIIDVKLGKNINERVLKSIKNLSEEDSTKYSDVIEMLEGKNIPSYSEHFDDTRLKHDLTEGMKEEIRKNSLKALKEILINPISKTLDVFDIKSYSNKNNYYKTYKVNSILQNFTFECSFVYNSNTKESYIDKLYVDSKGFKIMNEELGIAFALSAIDIINQAEEKRQRAISAIDIINQEEENK